MAISKGTVEFVTMSLTKRELYAAMAMQGVAASDVNDQISEGDTVRIAVSLADALIAELAKEPTP